MDAELASSAQRPGQVKVAPPRDAQNARLDHSREDPVDGAGERAG